MAHLILAPILLPLVSAAVLLLLGEQRRRLRSALGILASLAGLVVSIIILWRVDQTGRIAVYLASNWEAPIGIVLVADRLSALMLVLTSIVGVCAALHAQAAWSRVGVYFHPLFQVQLMGLSGAFLTGDLFNLFVFFEVMLAASYGLQLHGSGLPRVRSGLHYIAVNLLASALFLIGLAVLYGVLGTLNMADIAAKLPLVPTQDRGLLHAGVAILAVAFLIKAAIWPLNAWLVPAYTAATAPVAALFAVMTKVGIYTLLRLWTLFFSGDIGPSAHFGQSFLLYGGLATIMVGAIGMLTTLRIDRIASYAIMVSSGTLLAAIGMGTIAVTSAALFYMLSATVAVSALFLLVELIERIGSNPTSTASALDLLPGEDTNLDDEQAPLVGRVFPVSIAVLALAFMVCALLVAGLPPLSGFLAKLSLLTSVLDENVPATGWVFFGVLLVAGFAATVSFARAGIRNLWATGRRSAPPLNAAEAGAVVALLATCLLLTVFAEPVLRYTRATAEQLHGPQSYVESVLSTDARPRPSSDQETGR